MFNRLSGNTDNELGTALHPIVRHTLYTQGAKSFRTRDKGTSPRWKCNGTVLLGVSCLVIYSQSKGQYRDTTLQPGVAGRLSSGRGRYRKLEAMSVSPWNKCTHRHEGMQLQGDPRVCLWTARTETQGLGKGSWLGSKGLDQGAPASQGKGRGQSRCGPAGSAHHEDSFGVVWSLVG